MLESTSALVRPSDDAAARAAHVLPPGVTRDRAAEVIRAGLIAGGCPRSVAHAWLEMARFTRPSDWTRPDRDPMNHRKQAMNAASLGVTAARMWQIEKTLEQYRVIERVMPQNGQRGRAAVAGAASAPTWGLSFAPAIERYAVFAGLADDARRAAEEIDMARAGLRTDRGALRRAMRALEACQPADPLLAEAEALIETLPSTTLRNRDGAAFEAARGPVREMTARIAAAVEVEMASKAPNPDKNNCPSGQENFSCHTKNTTEDSNEIVALPGIAAEMSNAAAAGASPAPARPDAGDGAGKPPSGASPDGGRGEPDINLSLEAVLDLITDDFRMYLEAQDADQDLAARLWRACEAYRPELGINVSAWQDAVDAMGPEVAMLSLIVIDRNRFHPTNPTRSPGGLLREFTRRHRAGELRLAAAVWAILSRARLGKHPKSGAWEPARHDGPGQGGSAPAAQAPAAAPPQSRWKAPGRTASGETQQAGMAFPPHGSVRWDSFWDPVRAEECNWDPLVVADKFRRFCRKHGVALDDPRIETIFRAYARKLPRA